MKIEEMFKINPIKFNVVSIFFSPLQIVTHAISGDVFTVALVKMWVCYFCHFTIITPNPVNI